jgi:hypothetical protein
LVEDAALHHARAVVVLHGRLRNADVYYRSAMAAQAAAGDAGKATIMVVPQFLAEVDWGGGSTRWMPSFCVSPTGTSFRT